jgi:hypothetical protein
MRITNQNQPPAPSLNTSPDAAAPRNDSVSGVSSPPPSTPASMPVSLVPSFELLRLTAVLQQVPPVRQEVITETVRRLLAGQLQTPAALQQTAGAILGI